MKMNTGNFAASLCLKNVSWAPLKNSKKILHPINFNLVPGRVLGVVGPNGAGKSTLLRLIYRYLVPSSGTIQLDGIDIWSLTSREAACNVAAVLQEQTSDFALTVSEIVELGRTPHRKSFGAAGGAQDAEIVYSSLDRLNLLELSNRQLCTLSGGERQRVMVARALAQEPRLLILDEPTNHLDIRHQLEVLGLIRNLPITIVITLHDLNIASKSCDDVLILKAGRSLGFGPPDTVLSEETVTDAFGVRAKRERLMPSNYGHLTFQL